MKRPLVWAFIAYVIMILIGQYLTRDIVLSPPSEKVVLEGIVEDVTTTRTGRQSMTLRTDTLRIQCLLEAGESVSLGQRLTIEGTLQALEKPTNQGGFDEWTYYTKNKVSYKMFPKVLEKGEIEKSFAIYINDIRERLAAVYDKTLPEKESAIMKAMIIGDRSGLTDDLRELYRVAGIFHLLAISGLHVSILAILMNVFLSKIGMKRTTADITTILFLIAYTILTGASIATVRAAVMGIVVLVGYLLQRDNDILSAVSFAGLCLLIYEPYYLFDIGFQYSFVAITCLVLFTESMDKLIVTLTTPIPFVNRIFRQEYLRKYLAGCIIGDLAAIPITAYYFYYIQPYGIFTNLLIAASVQVLIILGFLVALTGLASQVLASLLATPLYILLRIYEQICSFFAQLPFSDVLVGRPSLIFIILFYLLLFAIKRDYSKALTKKTFLYTISLLLIAYVTLQNILPKSLEMTVLDVGQGDSIFFQKGNTTFVIDGGNQTALIPFMNYNGIQKVDIAFVSHTDGDHITGIIELAEQNRVSKVVLPIHPIDTDGLYESLRIACETHDIPIVYMKGTETIVWEDDFTISCLFPVDDRHSSSNNGSLVLKVQYRDISVLLTGDIEKETEERLLREEYDLQADILKVAHHGSKTSSMEAFIDQVAPDLAVVSTGRNNSYGHPSPEVTQRFEDRGIPLYDTAQHGAWRIITDGYKTKVVTMK